MSALYNELDPYAAQWIRNLVAANLVAPGAVDGRSIKELTASDVGGSGQRHFFAGIAVWSLALRMAGVPDDASVWTGSCPCQPFSAAGAGKGIDDERHLWPEWFRLIRESRPAVVFGEQVASPDGLSWLDAVRADLEGEGYAFGAADLCAAGVGAPHIRQRLFFGARRLGNADSESTRRDARASACAEGGAQLRSVGDESGASGSLDAWANVEWVDCDDNTRRPVPADSGDERGAGLGTGRSVGEVRPWGAFGAVDLCALTRSPFDDGARHPQPLIQSLAYGPASRVGVVRATGNAIVPQVAATFIRAFLGAS